MKIDPYKHKERYERWKGQVSVQGIPEINSYNSDLILKYLDDMENGMNVGFKESTGEFLITMDSDSIIVNGDSIYELIHPFKDPKVGAVSGNIQVLNKDKSLMTKIQWARYWLAFNVEKASQSPYHGVTCCSGPFSAYRKEYVMEYLDEWINQCFLGSPCTYGDDRGLTTLMLRAGYKVRFSKYALCVTNVPETLKVFTRQQIRWKKSFVRENYYLVKFLNKLNFMMKLEFVWFWIIFLMGFVAKILAFTMLLTGNYRLISFAIMIMFVAMLHYIYAFVRNPGRMGYYGVLYGFLNEFLIMWLFWYALFTLKETGWGTR
jgi:hyaluronan synthase/N-acetylglucosaminyltransferase